MWPQGLKASLQRMEKLLGVGKPGWTDLLKEPGVMVDVFPLFDIIPKIWDRNEGGNYGFVMSFMGKE